MQARVTSSATRTGAIGPSWTGRPAAEELPPAELEPATAPSPDDADTRSAATRGFWILSTLLIVIDAGGMRRFGTGAFAMGPVPRARFDLEPTADETAAEAEDTVTTAGEDLAVAIEEDTIDGAIRVTAGDGIGAVSSVGTAEAASNADVITGMNGATKPVMPATSSSAADTARLG